MEQQLEICSLNIRRGLLKRELELKNMLNSEKLDIMFLVETDTKMIKGKDNYKIDGYETIIQKTDTNTEKIRIIAYYHFNLATELKSGLAQCGLEKVELGKTYMTDRLWKDGTIIESALDHIYVSLDRNTKVTGKKWA